MRLVNSKDHHGNRLHKVQKFSINVKTLVDTHSILKYKIFKYLKSLQIIRDPGSSNPRI